MLEPHVAVCKCGAQMKREWSSTAFSFSFWYGYDVGAGKYFDSDRERNSYIQEKGLEKV
jgi:hypothetical protein